MATHPMVTFLVEMIITNGGFCGCYSAAGNIAISIPTNSSVTVYAKTDEDEITYDNLTISNLQESTGLLTGKLLDGNGEMHLETIKGNIVIKGL